MKTPLWWTRARTPSLAQLALLDAIAKGQLKRNTLFGTYEPHYLDGRDVSRQVRALQLKGLVIIRPLGPALLSRRGATLVTEIHTHAPRPRDRSAQQGHRGQEHQGQGHRG